MTTADPRPIAEINGFINLLLASWADAKMNAVLERLLSLPNWRRHTLLNSWLKELRAADAPKEFVEAVAWLMDDAVAEKAYEAIFKCEREPVAGAVDLPGYQPGMPLPRVRPFHDMFDSSIRTKSQRYLPIILFAIGIVMVSYWFLKFMKERPFERRVEILRPNDVSGEYQSNLANALFSRASASSSLLLRSSTHARSLASTSRAMPIMR